MEKILIIDDEEKLRGLLARILRQEGMDVLEAGDGKAGLKKIQQQDISVVLCDVKLPDISGVALISQIKDKSPCSEVILLTAYGNIPDGVEAIKQGAFDYLTKGDDNDRIIPLLHRALEKVRLRKRVEELQSRIEKRYTFGSMIGQSKAFLQAIEIAKKVTATDTTVLLTGETGTGKEVFAQAIHYSSNRSQHNFVALNCSAFNREILESELFGHKQGSFTGALKDKKGLIEEANNGTLFLDEIGEMPLDLQAKLLRVLETNEFIKLGDTKTTRINFRLIAATNRDLKAESEAGTFRSDLYFRLNVFEIPLPSLRERKKDIPLLADFYAQQLAVKNNKKIMRVSADYLHSLEQWHWPGNIRELKNVIERSVILCERAELTSDTLPFELRQAAHHEHKSLSAFSMASVEKLHIQKVLNYTQGNKAEAARLLEIGIATLYRKLDEYNIQ